MKYAVTKGTISCNAIHDEYVLKENEVLFEGDITENNEVVWDDAINNVRFKNADDLLIDSRELLKSEIDTLTSKKIAAIFGYTEKSIDLVIKQLNLNTMIDYLKDQSNERELTPQELATIEIGRVYFERISALRAYGKALLATVDSSDPTTFDIHAGWPE